MDALSMLQWYHIFLSLWNKQKFEVEVVQGGRSLPGLVVLFSSSTTSLSGTGFRLHSIPSYELDLTIRNVQADVFS